MYDADNLSVQDLQELVGMQFAPETAVPSGIPWQDSGADLTPSVQQGYAQLLPGLLKTVLANDDEDLGFYTQQGYYIPRGRASTERRESRRAQALDMMKGLMGQLNQSTMMGGAGRGLFGQYKVVGPGARMFGPGIDPNTGKEGIVEIASTPSSVKSVNGQLFDQDTRQMITDARDTPERAMKMAEGKEGPAFILKELGTIAADEFTVSERHRLANRIIKGLDDPEVSKFFGPGMSAAQTIAGIGDALFPHDPPDQKLAKAKAVLADMYNLGREGFKGMAPLTEPDVQFALKSIAGNEGLTSASIKALARNQRELMKRQWKHLTDQREGLAAYPGIDSALLKVRPRTVDLEADYEAPVPATDYGTAPAAAPVTGKPSVLEQYKLYLQQRGGQ